MNENNYNKNYVFKLIKINYINIYILNEYTLVNVK
jgi:hypothetical protein